MVSQKLFYSLLSGILSEHEPLAYDISGLTYPKNRVSIGEVRFVVSDPLLNMANPWQSGPFFKWLSF
jgi:hypothetical protein